MRILHLTDLHFNTLQENRNTKEKQEEILRIVAGLAKESQIHFLAVTGDFTCHGLPEEFALAEEFIRKLLETAGLTERQLFFCRGNHDADTDEAGSAFTHYLDFHQKLSGGQESIAYEMNTCSQTSLTDFDHALLLEEEVQKVCESDKHTFKMVLMHHQREVIANQDLYERLEKSADLILSGHLHRSEVQAERCGHTFYVNGLAVCPHLPHIPAGFQVLNLTPENSWEVNSYFI